MVKNAYAGGIVGKLSGGTVEYCENFGQVQAGWQNTNSSNKLTARDMFYHQAPREDIIDNGDDENREEKTHQKLEKKVNEINKI